MPRGLQRAHAADRPCGVMVSNIRCQVAVVLSMLDEVKRSVERDSAREVVEAQLAEELVRLNGELRAWSQERRARKPHPPLHPNTQMAHLMAPTNEETNKPRVLMMSTDLLSLAAAGGPLSRIETRHLLTMRLETAPLCTVGSTPNGLRRVGLVTGGTFAGDRLRGSVVSGTDWQLFRPDGSLTLDVRLVLQTDQGALITTTYRGLRHGPAEVIQRLERGEAIDPAAYYFRIAPMFEVDDPELDWLNRVQAVGTGHRFPDGPVYAVFEVL